MNLNMHILALVGKAEKNLCKKKNVVSNVYIFSRIPNFKQSSCACFGVKSQDLEAMRANQKQKQGLGDVCK
jgi:hypothetical protein